MLISFVETYAALRCRINHLIHSVFCKLIFEKSVNVFDFIAKTSSGFHVFFGGFLCFNFALICLGGQLPDEILLPYSHILTFCVYQFYVVLSLTFHAPHRTRVRGMTGAAAGFLSFPAVL